MVRHLGTGTEPEKPYHMLRPTRKYPLEEALNNQVDEMTLPVGISSCWCPPQGWYNGHTNIVAVVAKMEAMHGPPKIQTPTYQGQPRYCWIWMSNLPAIHTNAETLVRLSEAWLVIWYQVECIRLIRSWQASNSLAPGLTPILGMQLSFLLTGPCPAPQSRNLQSLWSAGVDLQNVWSTHHNIQSGRVSSWPQDPLVLWHTAPPRSCWPESILEWLALVSGWRQYPAKMGRHLPNTVHLLDQRTCMLLCL